MPLESMHRTAAYVASPPSSHLLGWLMGLGSAGLFAVAIIDSSLIPLTLPGSTDLLLLLLSAHPRTSNTQVVSLVACAIAGSIVGGYATWEAGRKGGVATLEKHVPRRLLDRITRWIERYGALSVAFAAMLPPPIPLLPFLLASGALGVSRKIFLLAYGSTRTVRYSLIGWLGFNYGKRVVRMWRRSLADWSTPILCIYGGLVVLVLIYGLWKVFGMRRKGRLRRILLKIRRTLRQAHAFFGKPRRACQTY